MPEAVMTEPGNGREVAFVGRSLRKTYVTGETEVHALRGVDLDIMAGEILVLLGPSGSGKSTLLNIVGGLDRPTSGTLWYRDTELTALDEADLTRFRRSSIGFIFQFYNLIPSLTAEENVRLVTDIAENPMSAKEALELVGLGTGAIISRPNCRAANNSASRLPGRLRNGRESCCATNPPERWTARPASGFWRRWQRPIANSAPP
tara:strand:- start:1273 stop:1887 length:615 start_codon:yes stop_codon:yes gene_type:complete